MTEMQLKSQLNAIQYQLRPCWDEFDLTYSEWVALVAEYRAVRDALARMESHVEYIYEC